MKNKHQNALISVLGLALVLFTGLQLTEHHISPMMHAAPPATKYTPGETLAPNCAPGDANCTVIAPAASGNNSDITDLSGLTQDITFPTQIGVGVDPGEAIHVKDGNILLTSSAEKELRFVWENAVENNPVFKLGRMVIGGVPGAAVFRFLYSDDVTAERSVFEVEDTGTVASVRAPGVPGSHFEAFFAGDSAPIFRLNSSPKMQLELGVGGATETDLVIRREDPNVMTFLTGGTGGTEQMRMTANGLAVKSTVSDVSLVNGGALAFKNANEATISITADNQAVSVGDRSFIRMDSNDAVAANRTFTLNPSTFGQIVVIHWNSANGGELVDTGNTHLNGDWTPGEHDTITLMSSYQGATHKWIELSRSDN